MPSPGPFQYQSSGFSEPGIFVELYLPKRAEFQEILYNTLTEGFKFKKVKEHFRNNRESIQATLRHHPQWKNYSEKDIRTMKPFYYGYSVYEVDGVFYSRKRQSGARTRSLRRLTIEERTQVIRMMFVPDLNSIKSQSRVRGMARRDMIDVIKVFLRLAGHRRGEHGANIVDENMIDRMLNTNRGALLRHLKNGNVGKVLDQAEKWFDDVGLFLFGYVIFEICNRIKILGDKKRVDYEEEIWLTSFWNLNVNRVKYRKGFRPER